MKVEALQDFEDNSFWADYDKDGIMLFKEDGTPSGSHQSIRAVKGQVLDVPPMVAQKLIKAKVVTNELSPS